MLAASVCLNVVLLVAIALLAALCRDLAGLAHDLMDPTQRARIVPPRAPDTLPSRMLAWLMHHRTDRLARIGASRPTSPASSPRA